MNWGKMIHEGEAWDRDKPALKGEIILETFAIGHFGNT